MRLLETVNKLVQERIAVTEQQLKELNSESKGYNKRKITLEKLLKIFKQVQKQNLELLKNETQN